MKKLQKDLEAARAKFIEQKAAAGDAGDTSATSSESIRDRVRRYSLQREEKRRQILVFAYWQTLARAASECR